MAGRAPRNPAEALRTYEDWKHCITVLCGIPLTRSFIEQRLAALRDPQDHGTRTFIDTWGTPHHRKVVEWFEQSLRERTESPPASPAR